VSGNSSAQIGLGYRASTHEKLAHNALTAKLVFIHVALLAENCVHRHALLVFPKQAASKKTLDVRVKTDVY
jgi:hypothetical protein